MGLFEQFPYTNFQEKNLDRIAGATGDIDRKVAAASDSASGAAASQEAAAGGAAAAQISADSAAASAEAAAASAESAATSAAAVIGPFDNINTRMDTIESRMDEFTNLPTGSTAGDAELADIRITFDGKTYPTAGDAVRAQANSNNNNIINYNAGDIKPLIANYTNSTMAGITFTWNNGVCNLYGTATGIAVNSIWKAADGIPPYIELERPYIFKITQGQNTPKVKLGVTINTSDNETLYRYTSTEMTVIYPANTISTTIRIYVESGAVLNNVPFDFVILSGYDNKTILKTISESNDAVFENYSDFTLYSGHYLPHLVMASGYYHTNLIRVRPETVYYSSDNISDTGSSVFAAVFDINKKYMGDIRISELEQINYQLPDGTGNYSSTDYANIWSFTTPANAAYISLNSKNIYRGGIASKPIYNINPDKYALPQGVGNMIIRADDPTWNIYHDKNLAIIGTSQVMIDRLARTGEFMGEGTTPVFQFVCGFQEYLIPYYNKVDTYGYSGLGFIENADPEVETIYKYIVTDQLDLSGYDEIYLGASTVGATLNNIGHLTSPQDLGEQYTLIGSIRRIIDYIYSINKKAKIYIQTRYTRPAYDSAAAFNIQKACNDEFKNLSKLLGIQLIDTAANNGFNQYTAGEWCYDTNGHYNHFGNCNFGQYIRKQMIGV